MANRISEATSFVGVIKLLKKNKYRAQIFINNKSHTKQFDTFGQAVVQRLRWERMRNEIYRRQQETSQCICTDNCKNCKYMKWFDYCHITPCCDYYLMTGNRRPCKAGDGCTVKLPRTKDHNERYRKHYSDSFHHTEEYKWRKARVDSELNIIRK